MARRPDSPERPLTRKELAEYRDKLAALKSHELEHHYRAAHNACRYDAMRLPSARLIQEFVQVWKLLRAVMKGGSRW